LGLHDFSVKPIRSQRGAVGAVAQGNGKTSLGKEAAYIVKNSSFGDQYP